MKVFVATDFPVLKIDGKYYVGGELSSNMKRYYKAFGKMVICTRMKYEGTVDKLVDISECIDSDININGLLEAFSGACDTKIKSAIESCDLVIARVPSIIAYRAAECAKKLGKPYFSEVMGCAWDAYWNHGIAGKIIAPYMFTKMKKIVYNSDFALYVTEKYLQSLYPCKNESIGVSDVKISSDVDSQILSKRLEKIESMDKKSVKILTAAAVNVRYKGHEYVIKALPHLNKLGIRAKYYLAGKGDQTFLRNLAEKTGVSDQVVFYGYMSQQELLKAEDDIDIYIQPSKQEGLPRALVEAMSRGCLCLGARTAGIPELLEDDHVFERGSVTAVVKSIVNLLNSDLKEIATRNYNKAMEFDEPGLNKKREDYYNKIISYVENK